MRLHTGRFGASRQAPRGTVDRVTGEDRDTPPRTRRKATGEDTEGLVPATCWCGRKVMKIHKSRLGKDTDSCGKRGCTGPGEN